MAPPHETLLVELRGSGLLEMDDAAVDGSHIRALKKEGGSRRVFASRSEQAGQRAGWLGKK